MYVSLCFSRRARITSHLKILFSELLVISLYDLTQITSYSYELSRIFMIICWYLVSPPELSRDTPITEIIDPVFEGFFEAGRDDFELFPFVSCDDLFCEDACSYEPLGRDDRFDTALAPLTESDFVCIGLDAYEIPLGTEKFDDIISSFFIGFLSGESAGLFIEYTIPIDDRIVHAETVPFGSFEVSRVMGGGDFYGSRSEFHIDHIISDDRDFSIDNREDDGLSDKFFVAFIFRVYCDCLICE